MFFIYWGGIVAVTDRERVLEAAKRIEACGLKLVELDNKIESADQVREVQRIIVVLNEHLRMLRGITNGIRTAPSSETLPDLRTAARATVRAGAGIRHANDQPILEDNVVRVEAVIRTLQKLLSESGDVALTPAAPE